MKPFGLFSFILGYCCGKAVARYCFNDRSFKIVFIKGGEEGIGVGFGIDLGQVHLIAERKKFLINNTAADYEYFVLAVLIFIIGFFDGRKPFYPPVGQIGRVGDNGVFAVFKGSGEGGVGFSAHYDCMPCGRFAEKLHIVFNMKNQISVFSELKIFSYCGNQGYHRYSPLLRYGEGYLSHMLVVFDFNVNYIP